MKAILTALTLICAVPAMAADILRVKATADVQTTMNALEAAVTGAGATVFARVDHAGGAASVGMALAESQLLIFGNPKLGTPAMQDDPLAGLFLPLKVLVFEDADGLVWLSYEDPAAMLGGLNVAGDAAYLGKMSGALNKLTGMAAGG